MSIFKNKHVRIAMVLAPVLGVVSYYVTRNLGSETPHAAEAGQSYQLVGKPNCRRNGGICELKNGDFELKIRIDSLGDDQLQLVLSSVFPLDGVKLALVDSEAGEEQPEDMQAMSDDGLLWTLGLTRPDPESDRLRLVASASRSLYFGDVSLKFTAD